MKRYLIPIALLALLVMAGPGWGADTTVYVDPDAGSSGCSNGSTTYDPIDEDCGGGGSETVYLEVIEGILALDSVDGDHTVRLKSGTTDEDWGQPDFTAADSITFEPEDSGESITIKVDDLVATWVWRMTTSAAISLIFDASNGGGISFDLSSEYDGGDIHDGVYLFYLYSGTGFDIQFVECSAIGEAAKTGNRLVFSSTASNSITFIRCEAENFGYLFTSNDNACTVTLTGNWLKSADVNIGLSTGATNQTVTMTGNTLYESSVLNHNDTASIMALVFRDNLIYGQSANIPINLYKISSLTSENNWIWSTDLPSPRTSNGYPTVVFRDGSGDEIAFPETLYFGDPEMDSGSEPAIETTSLLIGRGSSSGASIEGYNNQVANTATIGAWKPSSGAKRNITTTRKKVALVGDSVTYGTGATDAAHRYTNLLAAYHSDYSFIMMPGETDRHLGIYGADMGAIALLAMDFAVNGDPNDSNAKPETVSIYGGINDIGDGKSNAVINSWQESLLDALSDLGVKT